MKEILNPGQEIAAKKMKDFLASWNTKGTHFVLTGGPGTGKTFLISKILGNKTNGVAGTAISHAAKTILQKSLPQVKCYTLASLLGWSMVDTEDGSIKFGQNPNSTVDRLKGLHSIILDEASMIDDPTYEIIMSKAREKGIRIIAVGDKYQLPPVEQDHDSKFFDRIDAELTQPMRFSGPIQNLSETFRLEIAKINNEDYFDRYILNAYTNREDNYDDVLNSGYRFKNVFQEMIEEAAEEFKNNMFDNSHTRILAFKNDSVNIINNNIRRLLYGKNLNQFENGELIIANAPYNVLIKNHYGLRFRDISHSIIYNGQFLSVESYKIDVGPEGIPCAKLEFKDKTAGSLNYPVYAVTTDDNGYAMKKYYAVLDRLKRAALNDSQLWRNYYGFKSQFLWYNYAYSLNLYKAQGTTLRNVYVLDGEVTDVKPLTWKQKFQALYVAMTRATNNLTFYNKKY